MKFINQNAQTNAMHAMNAKFLIFVKIRMLQWMAAKDWWMVASIRILAESWWMVARRASCGGGETTMQRTRNSKELDAKTSNSTRRCRRRFNQQYTEKKMQQARTGCRMG